MVLFSFLLVLLLISLHSFKSLQLLLIVCSASEVLSALNDFEKTADDASEESAIFPELDSMETGFLSFFIL